MGAPASRARNQTGEDGEKQRRGKKPLSSVAPMPIRVSMTGQRSGDVNEATDGSVQNHHVAKVPQWYWSQQ